MDIDGAKPITTARMRMNLIRDQRSIVAKAGKSSNDHLLEKTSKALESLLAEGRAFEMLYEETQHSIPATVLQSVKLFLATNIAANSAHVLKKEHRPARSKCKHFAQIPAPDRYGPHEVLVQFRRSMANAEMYLSKQHFDGGLSEWCCFMETSLTLLEIWRTLYAAMNGNVTVSQVEHIYDRALELGADLDEAITLFLEERLTYDWFAARNSSEKVPASV